MPAIPFAEYRPDVADIDIGYTRNISNVIPGSSSYRPVKSLTVFSNALTARCQGAISVFALSGVPYNFAGDATKLYLLESATFGDKSKAGGYATASGDQWRFDVYGSRLIAVNGADTPQKWTLASSTIFADLGGSPPVAKYVAVVREFVFLANLTGSPNKARWCAFNNFEGWTIGIDQCNEQEFPVGGGIQGIVGGEVVYVFLKTAIYYGAYVGGDVIFQFDELESGHGCLAPGGIIKAGDTIYFIDRTGFYSLTGDVFTPIGEDKVDRTFLADLNQNYLDRIWGVYDWENRLVMWGYPSIASTTGGIDKILIYNPASGRWSITSIAAQVIYMSLQTGYTLDSLTNLGFTLDTLPASLDSPIWMGGALKLAAFNTDNKLAHFTGAPLAAQISTAEIQPNPGGRVIVTRGVPLVDASAATLSIGRRERYSDTVSYGTDAAMSASGACGVHRTGRSVQARVSIPAGTVWTHASGVHLDFRPVGRR